MATRTFAPEFRAVFNGPAEFNGPVDFNSTLSLNSEIDFTNQVTVTQPALVIYNQTGPAALLFQRPQTSNDAGLGSVVADTPAESGTSVAGAGTTIQLAGAASALDDYYIGWWIKVTSGPANNAVRRITAYAGGTRTATVDSAWGTAPGASNYELFNKSYAGAIYDQSNNNISLAYSARRDLPAAISGLDCNVRALHMNSTAPFTFNIPGTINTYNIDCNPNPGSSRTYTLRDVEFDGAFAIEIADTFTADYVDTAELSVFIAGYVHSISRKNNTVTITFPANSGVFAGTGNTEVRTLGAPIPAEYRPSGDLVFPAVVQDNSVFGFGHIKVTAAGSIHWFSSAAETDTWSGDCSFRATAITYIIT